MMLRTRIRSFLIVLIMLVFNIQHSMAATTFANAAEVRFENRRFSPQRVELRAGVPSVLTVVNAGKERIEFESFKLRREKVVEPGQTVVVHLPALRPGSYDFFDDFHEDVPEGEIVVR